MYREFALLKVKQQVTTSWEFPLTHEECEVSPLAGPLSAATMRRLDAALGSFPFARRSGDGRRAWTVASPRGGAVDVWLTSDGQIWLEGDTSLNLVYGLYVHLLAIVPSLAVEDGITGVLHNRASLLRLVRRDEERLLPYRLDDEGLAA